ncbi:hypothetical protein SLNWT_3364 [Streptomyces albus]|uniref:Uncharacterized protein n=1 Tax=Streptomyces albus (strain ATCC 21838 / DSM 41398 / FERM P-419 / JCM 4703 / NBRC 107858) TaxID=1081613 RepID=A0A0B5EWZ5_STRA4|nr:hypothetical protein SLNWT_3364 [Streptomyces albus]AOU78046.1 hypothetical protein SLNHY_3355 [Streptomyces albus]
MRSAGGALRPGARVLRGRVPGPYACPIRARALTGVRVWMIGWLGKPKVRLPQGCCPPGRGGRLLGAPQTPAW